ncbi:MAG: glycoside hydrolase family 3 C-terminal domain-containing protein [Oscillospiraceae bacterium]|nr:glycoside hydrolase family 3 C-terminal domain-containing protein [Oscillospiraceae bacterium]
MRYPEIIKKLSLEEKAALCSGKDYWHVNGIESEDLPSIMVSDGPHGLRKHNDKKEKTDVMGSVPAVAFPTASLTACSWDEDLLYKMGETLGEECLAEQISVLLGPGMNIKRSPVCGRNFEYFSEDPYLAGKIAAAFIKGVQSKGVGTSLKHFAANNQETRRMTIDTVADERTLREIYLAGFETAVKEAKPWTVMNAYNKLNGTYCAENDWLLNGVLRKEWGFDGVVVTDWGAENEIDRGIAAGQSLEMPGSNGLGAKKLINAVQDGTLSESDLDEQVDNIIDLLIKAKASLTECEYDKAAHHEIAREIAENSMVLLKNEDNILPLSKNQNICLIGELAKSPRYQGAGSSQINAKNIESAFDALMKNGENFVYCRGYDKMKDVTDLSLLKEAVECAKGTDVAVVFIGLTDEYESEGFDRDSLKIPQSHIDIVNAVAAANKNTVVVLSGGAPVEITWDKKVKGILNAYLGGEASGAAVANILYGKVNPSGKLAETYPVKFSDNPSYFYFPGTRKSVEYRESIYVGYRYYDKINMPVKYPFGYGLSYTSFEYSGLKLSKKKIKDTDTLKVSFKIKNTGKAAGAEIAQLYVKDTESTVFRPEKELKGFKKVFLEPGEEKEVSIQLDKRAFAYYNVNIHDWHVESGKFEIMIGASSRDIKLSAEIEAESTLNDIEIPDLRQSAPVYYTGEISEVSDEEFEALIAKPIPYTDSDEEIRITLNSSLEEADGTPAGKKINALLVAMFRAISNGNPAQEKMMTSMALQIPIRCFISMSMGVFTEDMAYGLCRILNGEGTMKGISEILGGIGEAVKGIGPLMSSI